MKGTTAICLLLTLMLVLMGVQTFVLWQKTQALEATLASTLDDLAALQESVSVIAEASETFSLLWNGLVQDGGPLSFILH
ncbi:MAG: hypothetical protein ACI4O7_05220 [Aristaeellaceae bacterium]